MTTHKLPKMATHKVAKNGNSEVAKIGKIWVYLFLPSLESKHTSCVSYHIKPPYMAVTTVKGLTTKLIYHFLSKFTRCGTTFKFCNNFPLECGGTTSKHATTSHWNVLQLPMVCFVHGVKLLLFIKHAILILI